ncbi:peroxidase-like [Spodoptera frugiperda]|uniref:Peroxidase-like n=1 Tax=Spodoptera frugiperda TaxID=7108 RepID=A0A9R0F2V9_SPOFR|nr:peroxidase-like [Spodoptera frugiperda]
MIVLMFLCLSNVLSFSYGIAYDSFNGTPISKDEVAQHIRDNNTFWCMVDIAPCDPNEWRRLDGSCNNLRNPIRGVTHTPTRRILPPSYDENYEPRKSKSGKLLPLVRKLRTTLLSEGQAPDQVFSVLASHYLIFIATDISNLHDTVNYIMWKPHCCTPKGKDDPMCAPIEVPRDDPVHRYSGIRCLNLTRPLTFQDFGCRQKNTPPERIQTATPLFDMSTVYGNSLDKALEGRKFEGGLLKNEVEDGRVWPPRDPNEAVCFMNQKPKESRCHKTPSDEVNTLITINMMSVWFWRLHNHIATRLAKLNPCWDDEKLFYTARDINIAIEMQIFLYELLPLMAGYRNLIRDGVIVYNGFRDIYNEAIIPQMAMEFPLALRWAHTMQEGTLKMYNPHGDYVKKVPLVELTIRTGYLGVDNNLDYLTQGAFRQPSAKVGDSLVDPDMADRVLGHIQPSQDVFSNDLAKNRLMFMQPYIKYIEHFYGRKINSFKDLADFFEPETLEKLSDIYESVEDIDLLAAMWVEKPIPGGYVPRIFYSILAEQLLHTMKSDRHWYERPNRPHAFTAAQLQEIRKMTVARFMCDVGDTVTQIQPRAFQRIGPGNELVSCDLIPDMDISAWKDNSCRHSSHFHRPTHPHPHPQ